MWNDGGSAVRHGDCRTSTALRAAIFIAVALASLFLAAVRLHADQTSPYCSSTADADNDKYECSTTVSTPDYGSGTRTINQWRWMGTLGGGGYNCCWDMEGIDVWDNNPNSPPPYTRQYVVHYGGEGTTHSNEYYPGYTYAYVFDFPGVTSGGNVFYCFRHHMTSYYDPSTGQQVPARDDYSSWQDSLDFSQGQSLGQPGYGCTQGY